MNTLVECVPNFSEGRDQEKIRMITDAIESVQGITLLDVDPGSDTNRTVVTFVGPVEAVEEAAFQGIKKARDLIDMKKHRGAHPRMGATDVCPFIPVRNVTMEDCVSLSKRVGERVGKVLDYPVYLYEHSASKKEWKNLAQVREGEYEALPEKLKKPEWKPDFGPAEFCPETGATAIGAREFLIAYNINLNTRDARLATDIAFELRERGRSVRYRNPDSNNYLDGTIIRYEKNKFTCGHCLEVHETYAPLKKHALDAHGLDLDRFLVSQGYDLNNLEGKAVRKPGLFRDVKAIGWYIDSFNRAQISINFTDYKRSPIHEVFDAAVTIAAERGVRVTGSELVGLIPLQAILMAGKYHLDKQGLSQGIPERDIVETAIQSLGLNDITGFNPDEKIIDYAVENEDSNPLMSMSSTDFINLLSTNSPAPGGGSVSALAGALGAALVSMVSALSHDKKGFLEARKTLNRIGMRAQEIKDRLADLVDLDTAAFNDVLAANRMPSGTGEEKNAKSEAILQANRNAIEVPLEAARLAVNVIELATDLAGSSFKGSISDVAVAGEVGLAAARGAALNVLINLPGVREDESYHAGLKEEIEKILKKAGSLETDLFTESRKIIDAI